MKNTVILSFMLVISMASLYGANKVIATSGYKSDAENSCVGVWGKELSRNNEFARQGYSYAQFMTLPNYGESSIENDVYAVASEIESELQSARMDVERIDLLGHSKGGLAMYNFSKIIANPQTEIYKNLSDPNSPHYAPHLMSRWKHDPLFIENVVTVGGTLNGTRIGLKALANMPISRTIMEKMAGEDEGAKDLVEMTKVIIDNKKMSKLDYYRALKDGPSYKTFIHMRGDSIVPRSSSGISYKGYNVILPGDHASAFDPKHFYFKKATEVIFKALRHDPLDQSTYNKVPYGLFAFFKDFPVLGPALNTLPRKIIRFIVRTGKNIMGIFKKTEVEPAEKKEIHDSLKKVELEIFGQ
ncbi:MAG: hypothetical protein JW827_08645 [Spirochaetes bacterium]|nr:hypothetical protein [Spirochaetota bacterium]